MSSYRTSYNIFVSVIPAMLEVICVMYVFFQNKSLWSGFPNQIKLQVCVCVCYMYTRLIHMCICRFCLGRRKMLNFLLVYKPLKVSEKEWWAVVVLIVPR